MISFKTIEFISHLVKNADKVVIVIRHAQRHEGFEQNVTLTRTGKQQALRFGQKLACCFGKVSLSFKCSLIHGQKIVRTEQTALYIAKGMNRAESPTPIETLYSHRYVKWVNEKKHSHSKDSLSMYSYGRIDETFGWRFKNLEKETQKFRSELFSEASKKLNVFIGHDFALIPLIVSETKGHVFPNLRYDMNRQWLNNMAGLAYIIHKDGTFACIPLKGLRNAIVKKKT